MKQLQGGTLSQIRKYLPDLPIAIVDLIHRVSHFEQGNAMACEVGPEAENTENTATCAKHLQQENDDGKFAPSENGTFLRKYFSQSSSGDILDTTLRRCLYAGPIDVLL